MRGEADEELQLVVLAQPRARRLDPRDQLRVHPEGGTEGRVMRDHKTFARVRIALAKNAGCLQNGSHMLLSLLASFAKQA